MELKTSAKAQRLCYVFAGSRHRCARQHPYDDNCHSDLSRDPVHHVWAVVPREHLHVQSRPRRCHRRLQCTPHQILRRWVFFFLLSFPTPMQKQQYWTMVNDTYEQMTGLTFDEILNEYGIELPESLHD